MKMRLRLKLKIKRYFFYILGLVSGILITGISLPYFIAGEIYDYQDTVDGVHLPEVDAIVCLAGGKGRISAAGDIWYRYREAIQQGTGTSAHSLHFLPTLYISGMGPQSGFGVFSRQVRKGIREVIKPENVILEVESTNTEANARWFAKYALKKGWKKILLITSPYHMKRSVWIFEQVLKNFNIPVKLDTLSIYQEPFEPGEWRQSIHGIHVTLLEYSKWIYYRWFWKNQEPLPTLPNFPNP